MADAEYYRQWFINCGQSSVSGIEPAILERTPYGDLSEACDLYESLDHAEQENFIAGLQSVVAGGDAVPIYAQILALDTAETENIWDIEPEAQALDNRLPEEPYDYDKRNPPDLETILQIDLRGAVNRFLISHSERRVNIR